MRRASASTGLRPGKIANPECARDSRRKRERTRGVSGRGSGHASAAPASVSRHRRGAPEVPGEGADAGWAARDSSAQGGVSGGRGDLHRLSRGVERRGGWYTLSAGLGSRVSALGSRVSALGSRLSSRGSRGSRLSSRVSGLGSRGSRVSGLGSRVSGLGSRVSALGSRVSALGSRVSGLGSRLSALGSRVSALGSLLIASSEIAPDAPSCGVRTAAGDCAVAGARPSTSCRFIRIDVRPCGVSEGPIFDLHVYIINRNIRKSPSHRGASGPATAGRWFRSAARTRARSCPGSVTMRVGRVRGRPGPASAGAAASRRRRRPPRRGGEKGKALQLRGFVPSHAMADTDRRGTGGPGASESRFTSRRAFSPPQLHESPWQAKTSPRRHESHRVSADRGRRPPNASNG